MSEDVITNLIKEDYEMVCLIRGCGKDVLSLADRLVFYSNLPNHEGFQIHKTPIISGGIRCC